MLAQAVKQLVRIVDLYLPDPYIFVLILTLIVRASPRPPVNCRTLD
jgi:short-chain fatty acids transporter